MRSFAMVIVMLAASPLGARAEQYVQGSQVVHTRLAPVVAHRIVPPYRGVHVYQGRAVRR